DDERASSPGLQSPPHSGSAFGMSGAPRSAFGPPTGQAPSGARAGLDIGSMISQTIQSSIPPARGTSSPEAEAPPRVPTSDETALTAKILERADHISSQNYFQMLGLESGAAPEEVQKAFFGLAKVWHPDRLPRALAEVKDACSKVFTHLTEAHTTLSDPEK